MDFIIAIVAIVALVIAVNLQSDVKMLKAENKRLKEMVQQLMNRGMPPKPQDVVPQMQQQTQPVVPAVVTPPKPVVHKEPKPQKNMENIFGKNVVGVVAAILMFIGIFAFGTLVFANLTDAIKVAGMFVLSGGTLAAGLVLNKKNPTVFSTIVTGCGLGMLYISVFLTHLHYHLIGDIATFTLIFLWAVGVSFLSKRFKMPSLSYLALAGCIISSILAQVYVVEQHMFVEITVYHFLTFLLLIIANKENTVLFKASAFTSIGLNTILSVIIHTYAIENAQYVWLVLCFILGVYNLAIGILAYRDEHGDPAVNDVLSIGAYVANVVITALIPLAAIVDKLIVQPVTIPDGIQTVAPINMDSVYFHSSCMFMFWAIAILAGTYAVQHFFIKDNKKRTKLFVAAEMLFVILTLGEAIELPGDGELAMLILLPIANLVLSYKLQDQFAKNVLYWSGFGIMLLDVFTSHFCLYDFGGWGIVYSVALLTLSCAYMFLRYGFILKYPFLQTAIINGHLLFTLLHMCENWTTALIIIVLLNMGWSALVQLCTKPPKSSTVLTECVESLIAFVVYWLVLDDKTVYPVGCFLLSVLLIPFMLTRLKSVIQSKNAFMSVWYGIKFTFYTFGTLELCTGFTEQQFIVSVVLMVLASACIAFGFWKELKALRIYGLALVMSSVAKMVILDVWNQESMVRVLSLIGGALICFGISAVYTKIEQRNQLTE
jgi:uncharacterized membrane protein